MTVDLNELEAEELWALFGVLADPDGVPAGERDPKQREQLRQMDAGFYVADRRECVSRRLTLDPQPGEGPLVELPGDPDFERS